MTCLKVTHPHTLLLSAVHRGVYTSTALQGRHSAGHTGRCEAQTTNTLSERPPQLLHVYDDLHTTLLVKT